MDLAKQKFIRKQEVDGVTNDSTLCQCGTLVTFNTAFRCLYCKEFFCEVCAEPHFGETVESRNEYFKYLKSKENPE